MLQEVQDYGQVLHFGGFENNQNNFVDTCLQPGDLVFPTGDVLKPKTLTLHDLRLRGKRGDGKYDRPRGWDEIRLKRVYLKELLMKLNGSEDDPTKDPDFKKQARLKRMQEV